MLKVSMAVNVIWVICYMLYVIWVILLPWCHINCSHKRMTMLVCMISLLQGLLGKAVQEIAVMSQTKAVSLLVIHSCRQIFLGGNNGFALSDQHFEMVMKTLNLILIFFYAKVSVTAQSLLAGLFKPRSIILRKKIQALFFNFVSSITGLKN